MAITFFLSPITRFAFAADLSTGLTDLSKEFSEKFCGSVRNGITPEKAGQKAAVQLSKTIFFSPIMDEIMSAPKEALAASLSNNIFEECGNNLEGTKKELDDYLGQLAKKLPTKSANSFQLAPIIQKSSK